MSVLYEHLCTDTDAAGQPSFSAQLARLRTEWRKEPPPAGGVAELLLFRTDLHAPEVKYYNWDTDRDRDSQYYEQNELHIQ